MSVVITPTSVRMRFVELLMSITSAAREDGVTIVAAFAADGVLGVQFHPEKSQNVGKRLLENFFKI